MADVFLTGAAGFVGRALSGRLLAEGARVDGADHPSAAGEGVAAVDLLDREGLARWLAGAPRGAVVVHAGAVSGQMLVGGDTARVFDVNVAGTVNVLSGMVRAGLSRLVHLSSNAVYRPRRDEAPVGEDAPLFSAEAYGASKVAAEAAVAAFADAHGLRATVLRLSSIYGPGRRSPYLLSEMIAAAAEGTPVPVTGEGVNMRQFLHVCDAVEAIRAAVAFADYGLGPVNVAGAERVSERAIGEMVRARLTALRLREVPDKGFPADNAIGPLDCTRAARLLGWRPRIPLAEGIDSLLSPDANGRAT